MPRGHGIKTEWTPEQTATLVARYATTPAAQLAAELGKTLGAVYVRAGVLGCRKHPQTTRVRWTPERDAMVRQLYGVAASGDLAGQLGCTGWALRRRANMLGVAARATAAKNYARDKRTIRRLRILLAVALDMTTVNEAAAALGIAPASVRGVLVREAASGAGEVAG